MTAANSKLLSLSISLALSQAVNANDGSIKFDLFLSFFLRSNLKQQTLKRWELQRCANDRYCLPDMPKVVCRLTASTADEFINKAAFREFLLKKFGVSSVDEENASIVMAAISPGVPVIVFRGVSNLAGGESTWSSTSLMDLSSANSLEPAVEFVRAIGKKKPSAFI